VAQLIEENEREKVANTIKHPLPQEKPQLTPEEVLLNTLSARAIGKAGVSAANDHILEKPTGA
jgi:hypothetical protein